MPEEKVRTNVWESHKTKRTKEDEIPMISRNICDDDDNIWAVATTIIIILNGETFRRRRLHKIQIFLSVADQTRKREQCKWAECAESGDLIARSRLFALKNYCPSARLVPIARFLIPSRMVADCNWKHVRQQRSVTKIAIWWPSMRKKMREERKKGKITNGNWNSAEKNASMFSLIHHQTNLKLVMIYRKKATRNAIWFDTIQ